MAIPLPEPGLVVSYSYLWHGEYAAGREEGTKNRPSVVVLVVEASEGEAPLVTVLPVTHSAPHESGSAIEIPARVKQHLGLDSERSWIVVSEGNEFVWPGYDLRKRPRSDSYAYGILPGRFYDQVRAAFVDWVRRGELKSTPRT